MSPSFLKYLGIITLFLLFHKSYSQAPVSPNSAEMIHQINVPVNLYNGVAGVSVPLYTVEANNGAQIPISLQYNAGGIRVDQVASTVGLGWLLSAGGSITRQIKGRPDIDYEFTSNIGGSYTPYYEYINDERDTEKDIFFYSFPGGSGKFFINHIYGTQISLPLNDITIKKVTNGWEIVDGMGNIYSFGKYSTDRESSSGVVTTWHLSEIKFLNAHSNKSISFKYKSAQGYSANAYKSYEKVINEVCDFNVELEDSTQNFESGSVEPKLISEILFPKGKVTFDYDKRLDYTGEKLVGMSVWDNDGKEIISYHLNHSYFDASDSYYKGGKYIDTELCISGCKRLKLDGVDLVGKGNKGPLRRFDYANDKVFDAAGYDLYELPPKGSFYQDHWGYYNGGPSQGTLYVPFPKDTLILSDPNETYIYPGMDKEANSSAMANILTKVFLPGGGYTMLEYENHDSGGGVRIRSEKTFDDKDSLIAGKEYFYYVEEKFAIPKYFETRSSYNCGPTPKNSFTLYSSTRSLLTDVNGTSVGYDSVRVVDLNLGGYSDHFFVNFSERLESYPDKFNWEIDLGSEEGYWESDIDSLTHPYVGREWEYHDRGFEYASKTYDVNGKLRSESETILEEIPQPYGANPNYFLNLHIGAVDNDPGGIYEFRVAKYYIRSREIKPIKTINKIYEDGHVLTTTTDISYYPKTYFSSTPKETITTNHEGIKSKSITRYPVDFYLEMQHGLNTNAEEEIKVLYDWAYDHAVNDVKYQIPIQQDNYLAVDGQNYELVSSSFNTFKDHGALDFITPLYNYGLRLNEPIIDFQGVEVNQDSSDFDIDYRYDSAGISTYDLYGNLVSQTGLDGVETTYTYDQDKNYVIAKSTNGQTTNYHHIPLVGVDTITDPNGKFMVYEYDEFNRLKQTRDHEGNIIKRMRYHYNSEEDSLKTSIQLVGKNKVGETLAIKSTRDFYGPTSFFWDYGDDNETQTTLSETSHVYASAGDMEISLTLLNPEFPGPGEASVNQRIYANEISPEICADYVVYNRCTDEFSGAPCEVEDFYAIDESSLIGAYCIGPLSYQWEYKPTAGSWTSLGSSKTSIEFPYIFKCTVPGGNYLIRCVVTDDCNNQYVSNEFSFTLITDIWCDCEGN